MKRFALLGLTAVLFAGGGASADDQCAKVSDQSAKQLCYEDVAKKEPQDPPKPPGKWDLMTETSKMDDSQTFNLNLVSEQFGADLHIRCEEKVTSVYFMMGDDFLADIEDYGNIRYRLDSLNAQKKAFEASTDNGALGLWSGRSAIPFIKQMVGHQKLVAEITAYNESPTTVEFDLTGMEEAIQPLRKACKW